MCECIHTSAKLCPLCPGSILHHEVYSASAVGSGVVAEELDAHGIVGVGDDVCEVELHYYVSGE